MRGRREGGFASSWKMGCLCILFALFGCATAGKQLDYDGMAGDVPIVADSTYLIPIHIENHRIHDASDPEFVLIGSGRHSFGIVGGINGRLDRLVDRRWFAGGDCFTIVAHYVGAGDLAFDQVCWKEGERIVVSLDNIFSPGSAWSHR